MNSWMSEFENNVKIGTLGKKRRTQQLDSAIQLQSSLQTEVIQTKLSKLSLEEKYYTARREQWHPYTWGPYS